MLFTTSYNCDLDDCAFGIQSFLARALVSFDSPVGNQVTEIVVVGQTGSGGGGCVECGTAVSTHRCVCRDN